MELCTLLYLFLKSYRRKTCVPSSDLTTWEEVIDPSCTWVVISGLICENHEIGGHFGDMPVALLALSRQRGCHDNQAAANGRSELCVTIWMIPRPQSCNAE